MRPPPPPGCCPVHPTVPTMVLFCFAGASAYNLGAISSALHCTLQCPPGLLVNYVCHSGMQAPGSPLLCTALQGALPPWSVYKFVVFQDLCDNF